jgi:peptidoglycan/LPS O-acetylase OafA/YrhL
LDGIRGLTALAVVSVHGLVIGIALSSHPAWVHVVFTMRIWLPLFFFLSGFLLYRPYVLARVKGRPRPSTRTFWWRRILRLVPAYWVGLTLLAIWPGLPDVFTQHFWKYYGLVWIYSRHTINNGLIPAWTLSVDVAFYIVLPFYAMAMERGLRGLTRRRAMQAEFALLGALAALGILYWVKYLANTHLPDAVLELRKSSPMANLDWIAIGMAFAIVTVADLDRPTLPARLMARRWAVPLSLLVAFAGLLLMSVWIFSISQPVQHVLSGLVCVFVFAPAVFAGTARATRAVFANAVVAWFGLISYGIYMYHGPLMTKLYGWIEPGRSGFLAWVVLCVAGMAAAVALGAASYYIVELPFLRQKYKPGLASLPGRRRT